MKSRYPSPLQFALFAGLATMFAIIAFWAAVTLAGVFGSNSVEEASSVLSVFWFGLCTTLVFGWVFWSPILLFALFPGCVAYVFVRNTLRRLRLGKHVPNLAGAAATAFTGWFLAALLLSGPNSVNGPSGTLFLLILGIPAAMIAACIALPTIE